MLTVWQMFLVGGSYERSDSIDLMAVQGEQGHLITLTGTRMMGTGRVFIQIDETLQGTDTQLSFIKAVEVTCQAYQLDCAQYDFIFSVDKEGSDIIKGPSAGVAVAILVYHLVMDLPVPEEMTATGSINIGGLVGRVDGINGKVLEALRQNKTAIYIPYGSNSSQQGAEEVFSIYDIIQPTSISKENIFHEKLYEPIANVLCSRADALASKVNRNEITERIFELVQQGKEAQEKAHFYSAGSFCFNANLLAQEQLLREVTPKELNEERRLLEQGVEEFVLTQEPRQENIMLVMTVSDRIYEVSEYLNHDQLEQHQQVAYAKERYVTAQAWNRLLRDVPGEKGVEIEHLHKVLIQEVLFGNEQGGYIAESEIELVVAIDDMYVSSARLLELAARQNTLTSLAGESIENYAKRLQDHVEGYAVAHDAENVLAYAYIEYGRSLIESGDYQSSIIQLHRALVYIGSHAFTVSNEIVERKEIIPLHIVIGIYQLIVLCCLIGYEFKYR